MNRKTLRDVLGPSPNEEGTLRWQTTVTLATNALLLFDWFQFALAGAAIVLISLCAGVRVTEGFMTVEDFAVSLKAAAVVFAAVMAAFVGASVLFFGNRYFAVFLLDASGVYHEGTRGEDERRERFSLRALPYPVVGRITARRARSRRLPWEKINGFQNIPSMRVIVLRRNFWHMLRLYMPDDETHNRVATYLAQRLPQR